MRLLVQLLEDNAYVELVVIEWDKSCFFNLLLEDGARIELHVRVSHIYLLDRLLEEDYKHKEADSDREEGAKPRLVTGLSFVLEGEGMPKAVPSEQKRAKT